MPEPQKGGTRPLSRNPEPASRKPRPGLGGALLACAIAVFGAIGALAASAAGSEPWITTWAATPAPRWAEELPAPFGVPEVLQDQTVRQVARVSVGGDQVRVVLSNEFGSRPVTVGAGSVALAGKDGALASAAAPLAWDGRAQVVIPPSAFVLSDPIDLKLAPLVTVAVSFYLPKKTALSSVHWDGVQTGYISGPETLCRPLSSRRSRRRNPGCC